VSRHPQPCLVSYDLGRRHAARSPS
jgi:hypothetical protein